ITWSGYVNERLGGLEHRTDSAPPPLRRNGSRDAIEFPDFYPEYKTHQGIEVDQVGGWFCTGELRYTGHAALQRDIANLQAGLAEVDVVAGFLPVVAPASVANVDRSESPYATERDFVFAVAEALREEYRTILDAGLELQVDD